MELKGRALGCASESGLTGFTSACQQIKRNCPRGHQVEWAFAPKGVPRPTDILASPAGGVRSCPTLRMRDYVGNAPCRALPPISRLGYRIAMQEVCRFETAHKKSPLNLTPGGLVALRPIYRAGQGKAAARAGAGDHHTAGGRDALPGWPRRQRFARGCAPQPHGSVDPWRQRVHLFTRTPRMLAGHHVRGWFVAAAKHA
jgi:hypothetical protein